MVFSEIKETSFSPGSGHEYSDLEEVMKKMEHWAHRLYPKLPFDDVTDRIAVLGKKQVHAVWGTRDGLTRDDFETS